MNFVTTKAVLSWQLSECLGW